MERTWDSDTFAEWDCHSSLDFTWEKVNMAALAIFLVVWLWWLNHYDIQETTNAFKPSASTENILAELLWVDAHTGLIDVTFVQKAGWHFFPMLWLLEGPPQPGMGNQDSSTKVSSSHGPITHIVGRQTLFQDINRKQQLCFSDHYREFGGIGYGSTCLYSIQGAET